MKAIVKNFDTQEVITTCKIKGKIKRFSDIMNEIEKLQENTNFLGIDTEKERIVLYDGMGLGIRQCYEINGMYSSARCLKSNLSITHTGNNSCVINPGREEKVLTPENVKVFNKETGEKRELSIKLEVIAYPEGYIISTGKSCHNIFGGSQPAYFSKITSRNFKCASKNGAKLFATPSAALKYVLEQRDVFEYMVSNHGYYFNVEFANAFFEEDENKLPEKKKAKATEDIAALDDLFFEINNIEEKEEIIFAPEIVTDEVLKNEAVSRMLNMGIMDSIIQRFEENDEDILFSEFGGILYDLNEEAKKAVKIVKEKGYLPYHVIRTQTEVGDLYAVLYVTKDTENWSSERRNRYGEMISYVYNATNTVLSERGYITVDSCNGGLQRTA